jgi:DNA polymerase III subunit gamma/tau
LWRQAPFIDLAEVATVKLDVKYRPHLFEDVKCQQTAVTLLSRMVKAGRGESLLLQGDYGSGKTTLARIFAKALNCAKPNENGSPCGTCSSCLGPSKTYLLEYDVPGLGGEKEKVRPWVDENNKSPRNSRWRVLFLDEAHDLTVPAINALLKDVEEPQPNVIFIFATTEPWRLTATLRSRLMDVEVHALNVADAVDFLKEVATKENIPFDLDGLILLASIKKGHPRDLLVGLDQVASIAHTVTAKAVRDHFGTYDLDHLIAYCNALADGNVDEQIAVMRQWHQPLINKILSLQVSLTSIFYNEILGRTVLFDPLIDSVADTRAQIVSRMCVRLKVASGRDLRNQWARMLEFWNVPAVSDEQTLRLRLSLFENLVNHDLLEVKAAGYPRTDAAGASVEPQTPVRTTAGVKKFWDMQDLENGFISPKHIRHIINRASFLIQHYDRFINATFTVLPSKAARASSETAIEEIEQFSDRLNEWLAQDANSAAAIVLLERGDSGVIGRVAAYIPGIFEREEHGARLGQWCEGYGTDRPGTDIEFGYQPAMDPSALTFHWDAIFNLCAGLDETDDRFKVLDRLKISKRGRRRPGPVEAPLLRFTGCLTTARAEEACRFGMLPLSAFDAKRWHWIQEGWEREEYGHRRQLIDERRQQVEQAARMWATDKDRRDAAIQKLESSWAVEPESRPRKYKGWWHDARR